MLTITSVDFQNDIKIDEPTLESKQWNKLHLNLVKVITLSKYRQYCMDYTVRIIIICFCVLQNGTYNNYIGYTAMNILSNSLKQYSLSDHKCC